MVVSNASADKTPPPEPWPWMRREERLLLVDLPERLAEVDPMPVLKNAPDLGCLAPGHRLQVEHGLVAVVPGRRAHRMNHGSRSGAG